MRTVIYHPQTHNLRSDKNHASFDLLKNLNLSDN